MAFDYSRIPPGFYDAVLKGPKGIRKFWHYHKFESVVRFIPPHLMGTRKRILDVGCFGGSFLGMLDEAQFSEQLGVDILKEQVTYASSTYGTAFRRFELLNLTEALPHELPEKFHVITLIEVIEHLTAEQINRLLQILKRILHEDGVIIITTPNYLSLWPLLEFILNRTSSINYEEQHLTKLNYWGIESSIKRITNNLSLKCTAKTTSHSISPFLAGISYEFALRLATQVPAANWKNPFGNIIISKWTHE